MAKGSGTTASLDPPTCALPSLVSHRVSLGAPSPRNRIRNSFLNHVYLLSILLCRLLARSMIALVCDSAASLAPRASPLARDALARSACDGALESDEHGLDAAESHSRD